MTRTWLWPATIALAVALVVGGLAWSFRPGPDDSAASAQPGAGDVKPTAPEEPGVVVPPVPPDLGGGEPGDPGDGGKPPAAEQPPGDPATDLPLPALAVVPEGYVLPRPDHASLTLNYAIGVPECYGTLGDPRVEETDEVVTVWLTRVLPVQKDDVACIDIALLRSVDVPLTVPLGSRNVRDGWTGQRVGPSTVGYGDY